MDEYINRQEAIKALYEVYEHDYPTASGDFDEYARHDVRNVLNGLPTADVQLVKHGRWIWLKNYRDCEGDIYAQYKCSCCDFVVGNAYSIEDLTHFCGNCGADMRTDGDKDA